MGNSTVTVDSNLANTESILKNSIEEALSNYITIPSGSTSSSMIGFPQNSLISEVFPHFKWYIRQFVYAISFLKYSLFKIYSGGYFQYEYNSTLAFQCNFFTSNALHAISFNATTHGLLLHSTSDFAPWSNCLTRCAASATNKNLFLTISSQSSIVTRAIKNLQNNTFNYT